MHKYIDNIYAVLGQATLADWTQGRDWYSTAHDAARSLAERLCVPVSYAAYAIAALSPRTSWVDNLRAVYAIADYIQHGRSFDSLSRPLRVTHVNRDKAIKILTTGDLSAIGQGQKTLSFADNILYPDSSQAVTIDGWAYRIAAGLVGKTNVVKVNIRGQLYDDVANAYRIVAHNLDMLPLHVQAIAWVTAHRLEGR